MRNSSKALLGLVLHQEGKQVMDTLDCSPRRQGPLNRVRVGMGTSVGPEGGLGGLPTHLVVHLELGFAPDTSEVAVRFLFTICPNSAYLQLFLVHCSFFVFCFWRRPLSRCRWNKMKIRVICCHSHVNIVQFSLNLKHLGAHLHPHCSRRRKNAFIPQF